MEDAEVANLEPKLEVNSDRAWFQISVVFVTRVRKTEVSLKAAALQQILKIIWRGDGKITR